MEGTMMNGTASPSPVPPATTNLKGLLVLDFDHTVMDVNTDLEVSKLEKNGHIPIEFNKFYVGCWTDYMQAVFEFLHQQGVRKEHYTEWAGKLPFTHGMDRLIRLAGENKDYEIVILSDANSIFISTILNHHGLLKYVRRAFTNPAHFDDAGCLRIAYFHTQTECELSEKNMCKGRILNDYVKERKNEGVQYDRLIYAGDGKNDYCPVIRSLGKNDHAFARKGYTLEKLVKQNADKVQCQVHIWSSGDEISSFLEL